MRAEEADLARKLRAVRDLLAAYGEDVGAPNVSLPATAIIRKPEKSATASQGRGKVSIDGFGPYGKRIVATAMAAMLMSPDLVKTREIVAYLELLKVSITGENKVNAVGALLSRSADIVSHGKAGWAVLDADMAHEIVLAHAHKENEASEADAADASETALHALEGSPQE